jgi:hypothetical protein
MYYNQAQKKLYEPPMYNEQQRIHNFGLPGYNEMQYNQYVSPGYNNAQADLWGLPKKDYATYKENYYKANNQW